VSRKPPELPNIEDTALRAYLAPLMNNMTSATEPAAIADAGETTQLTDQPKTSVSSNDNPAPSTEVIAARECPMIPRTLAEWRSLADADFGAYRMIELFLGMTDAELETAAAEFPKQIGATVRRICCLKTQLATRYDAVTTVNTLLERAMGRVAARPDGHLPAARPDQRQIRSSPGT
jgi:hypothetical protein